MNTHISTALGRLRAGFSVVSGIERVVSSRRVAVACVAAAAGLASAQLGPLTRPSTTPAPPAERVLSDTMGGSTEHFSIDDGFPNEFVSVGMREIPGVGRGLHVVGYNSGHVVLRESLFVPVGTADMVGYSVDTASNGDVIVAGEGLDDTDGGLNVFVLRLTRDLQTVIWSKKLPGSYTGEPSVTVKELADTSIVLTHNEIAPPGGDITPGEGRITRLDPSGNLIWSTRLRVPNTLFGSIELSDIAQAPDGALWVAGSCSASPTIFETRDALLVNIELFDGCPAGEGGIKFPHPSFEITSFSSLSFDVRPGTGAYTIVAAGPARGNDLFNILPRPRVVDVPSSGGGPNWDEVYDTAMEPAPSAITVYRANAFNSNVRLSGTGLNAFTFTDEAKAFSVNTVATAAALVSSRGSAAMSARFNDHCDRGPAIGGRDFGGPPADLYYVSSATKCTVDSVAPAMGPGQWSFMYPDCFHDERIEDLPLMDVGSQSFEEVFCRGWKIHPFVR